MDIPTFTTTQLALLTAELAAETASTSRLASTHSPKALARAGLALLHLRAAAQRTGLGGKTIVELELDGAVAGAGGGDEHKAALPEHGIRAGDIVGVREHGGGGREAGAKEKKDLKASAGGKDADKGVSGVVVKVGREGVSVALDADEADVPGGGLRIWIVKLANDITYKRMNDTMRSLTKAAETSSSSNLTRVLFGHAAPTTPPSDPDQDVPAIPWIDPTLNASQKSAIAFALAAPEVALIHGPPGTGKTHTLIELILQLAVKQNKRLLVCGPSNISVDNIVERLASAPHKVPMVRVGHPARLLPSVVQHSLDVLTRTSDAAELVRDIRLELDQKQASIRKTRNGRERRQVYLDMRELRKEYRAREKRCTDELVGGSRVVLATLHGAGGWHVKGQQFDVLVIDEASQALEAACWVPLVATGVGKVVFAGDHLQLPPTIKSKEALESNSTKSKKKDALPAGLETTLFDRLLGLHGESIKRMLTTQYRMHDKINAFPSKELYEGKLVSADAVKSRLLKDLPGVRDTEDTRESVVFFDTQGGEFPEKADDEDDDDMSDGKKKRGLGSLGESKSNELEAALVKVHVGKLVEAGVSPDDIAVVTPYNGQLSVLTRLLREDDVFAGIELGSIDGFQGREKEAVVVSLVRSNAEHDVGFLAEKRRLNVAMTRPKRHLCVIGDSETVARGSGFLKRWMAFLEDNSDLRYPDASTLLLAGGV